MLTGEAGGRLVSGLFRAWVFDEELPELEDLLRSIGAALLLLLPLLASFRCCCCKIVVGLLIDGEDDVSSELGVLVI